MVMKRLRWLIGFLLLLSSFAWANPRYYPDEFLGALEADSLRNQALKAELFEILSLYHNPTAKAGDWIDDECLSAQCFRHDPVSYKHARKVLFGRIHLRQIKGEFGVQDVYCDRLRLASEFKSRPPAPMQIPNAQVVNAEHTWPQSRFSKRHERSTQKADLHGLYPVFSRVNSSRGNSPFGDIRRAETQICPASGKGTSTESGRSVFEPPNNHKGNVARALFYFSVRYQMPIDQEQESFLRLWHVLDPVDEPERERNAIVFETQFNRNPFVDIEDLPSRIDDF